MNPAGNDPKPCPQPAAAPEAKKSYETPAVKVYGDVRDLTGSTQTGTAYPSPFSSPPHFS